MNENNIKFSDIHINSLKDFTNNLTNKIERASKPKMNPFHKGFVVGLRIVENDLKRFIKEKE